LVKNDKKHIKPKAVGIEIKWFGIAKAELSEIMMNFAVSELPHPLECCLNGNCSEFAMSELGNMV